MFRVVNGLFFISALASAYFFAQRTEKILSEDFRELKKYLQPKTTEFETVPLDDIELARLEVKETL